MLAKRRLPLFPGLPVEHLLVDISVEEPNSGITNFGVEDVDEAAIETGGSVATARFEARNVPETSSLPKLLHAFFEPGPLPDEGLFLSDGNCFAHIFNPATFLASVGSMARNIVFVIDVSGSMGGEKLQDAQSAFAAMIETLDERDNFFVQTFSDRGTEDLFGGRTATSSAKEEAKSFVSSLETIGGTNLNGAFLDGISRVRGIANAEKVPIIVMLTDGQGNLGPRDVAINVLDANEGGRVKVFNLAFGHGADYNLLLGISIQNGGQTIRVYEGFGDAVSQMELFYRSELGSVLLSDIVISYDDAGGNMQLTETTNQQFPILAGGSEIVVRGRLDHFLSDSTTTASSAATRSDEPMLLRSTIIAQSAEGPQNWLSDHEILPISLEDAPSAAMDECHQSFAQARITELLEFRDAERALGEDLFGRRKLEGEPSFGEQAENLALSSGLVWPGLTALVTVEGSDCNTILDGAVVCLDGDAAIIGGGDEGGVVLAASPSARGRVRSGSAPLVSWADGVILFALAWSLLMW
jgi:uncharacterized protein YegL